VRVLIVGRRNIQGVSKDAGFQDRMVCNPKNLWNGKWKIGRLELFVVPLDVVQSFFCFERGSGMRELQKRASLAANTKHVLVEQPTAHSHCLFLFETATKKTCKKKLVELCIGLGLERVKHSNSRVGKL
jgi:hypothetical protein